MLYILNDRLIRIEWSIFKGTSQVSEDFSRALVKVFLIGPNEKYLLNATAEGGTLLIDVPEGLPEGAYSIEAIYVKNYGNLLPANGTFTPSTAPGCHRFPLHPGQAPHFIHPHDHRSNDRCLMRSRMDYVFAITSIPSEESGVPSSGEITLRFKSSVASYGYDGLSAYEIAVMRGDFNGSEKDFLQQGYGNITNLPDEEFLTADDKKITLKDKVYSPNSYSGMGRRILRKNMVNGVNVLTQKMMQYTNTIYVITYDYDLSGAEITIPENCVLQFEGGSLNNGLLVGNTTSIKSSLTKIFSSDLLFSGKWILSNVFPEWFGLKINDSSYDNHNEIIAAVRLSYIAERPIIQFPAGTIYTSPISFKEFAVHEQDESGRWSKDGCLYIKGVSGTLHSVLGIVNGTIIKALSGDDNYALFKLCSEKDNKSGIWDEWSCSNILIEHINFDGNDIVNHGVNGNLNLTMNNCFVGNCVEDGIVCEDYSYPITLNETFSCRNGASGVYIKGPHTTCVNFTNCEFNNNEKYGMYIEGGAYSVFNSIKCQSNKAGGVYIIMNRTKYPDGDYFLSNLYFNNLYLEANGTLDSSNPNYTRNIGVYIGANPLSQSNINKPNKIIFNGGSLTKGTGENSYAIYIDNVYGLTLDCTYDSIYVNPSGGTYCTGMQDISDNGYLGTSNAAKSLMTTHYNDPFGKKKIPFIVYRAGLISNRGQTHKYIFKYDGIKAGETKYMKIDLASPRSVQFISIKQPCSLKSITLAKTSWKDTVSPALAETFSGTLTAEVVINYMISGIFVPESPSLKESIVLDNTTTNYSIVDFKLLDKEVINPTYRQQFLLVRLTASEDYSAGKVSISTEEEDSLIECIVEVEETISLEGGIC